MPPRPGGERLITRALQRKARGGSDAANGLAAGSPHAATASAGR